MRRHLVVYGKCGFMQGFLLDFYTFYAIIIDRCIKLGLLAQASIPTEP